MRRLRIALAVAALLTAGAAQAGARPIEGLWRVLPHGLCQADGDRVPIRITAERVEFYESACTIAERAGLGVGAAERLVLSCAGEGEEWRRTLIALPGADGRLYLFSDDGAMAVHERCAE